MMKVGGLFVNIPPKQLCRLLICDPEFLIILQTIPSVA